MGRLLSYARRIQTAYGYRKALFFYFYVLFHRNVFAKLFTFIETALPENTPDIQKIRIALRAAFRFINPQFTSSKRIDVLINHYSSIVERFSLNSLPNFLEGHERVIATIIGISGKQYIISAASDITKEGTIRIVFAEAETQTALAFLSGALGDGYDGHLSFWIGMLRGPGGRVSHSREIVATATRDLNGLRPKQAVLNAAAALAEWFGAQTIIAPSTENQIAIRNWFKGQKIRADHNPFWEEFAQDKNPDGSYRIDLPLRRRTLANVQQKRRKAWVLRYQYIDALMAEIKNTLDALSHSQTTTAAPIIRMENKT